LKEKRKKENFDCFWIAKSIGWALRHYSRTDRKWVESIVERMRQQLPPLSSKEALRLFVNIIVVCCVDSGFWIKD
jgi:3-methyladenine DNA glycosylase AlkD